MLYEWNLNTRLLEPHNDKAQSPNVRLWASKLKASMGEALEEEAIANYQKQLNSFVLKLIIKKVKIEKGIPTWTLITISIYTMYY